MRLMSDVKSRAVPLLVGLIAASALAACGGGGGDSVFAPAITTIAGTLTSTTGGAIAGATVQIGTSGSTTGATTTTNAAGAYSVSVPTSVLNTATTVVVAISAPGYQTCTTDLTLSAAGGTVTGCTSLTPVNNGEYYPAAGAVLTRLGDGQAPGTVNAQLQVGTPLGLSTTIQFGSPAGLNFAGYQFLTVSARIRGLEASICADKITIFQGTTADPATSAFSSTYTGAARTLADSPSTGAFGTYLVKIPVASFSATAGNLYIKLESGTCTGATAADPNDDFEFVDVNAKFTAS